MAIAQRQADVSAEPAAPTQPEELLDLAIELTFPASDPVSIAHAFGTASARERET